VACMAHARRKFFELHEANKSTLALSALEQIGRLYEIERQAKELDEQQRHKLRQQDAKPIADDLHTWLVGNRQKVPDGSATAKAIDYSLKRWDALIRYLDDGAVPIDNNQVENQIRPWALGRKNWLCVPRRPERKDEGSDYALLWMRVGPSQRDYRITLQTA